MIFNLRDNEAIIYKVLRKISGLRQHQWDAKDIHSERCGGSQEIKASYSDSRKTKPKIHLMMYSAKHESSIEKPRKKGCGWAPHFTCRVWLDNLQRQIFANCPVILPCLSFSELSSPQTINLSFFLATSNVFEHWRIKQCYLTSYKWVVFTQIGKWKRNILKNVII